MTDTLQNINISTSEIILSAAKFSDYWDFSQDGNESARAHTISTTSGDSAKLAHIYGTQSFIIEHNPVHNTAVHGQPSPKDIISGPLFQIILLVIFAGYCVLMYKFRKQAVYLVKMIGSRLYSENLLRDSSFSIQLFLRLMMILGMMTVGVGLTKIIELYLIPNIDLARQIPVWSFPVIIIAASLLPAVIMFYRWSILKLVGAVIMSNAFTTNLLFLNKLIGALSVALITPTLLLLAMNDTMWQMPLVYLLMVELIFITIFTLHKTYLFFVEQNVSILHWFLYLCAVEIFPIAVFILALIRN